MVSNAGYSKERILEELAKCEILCANCHRCLTYDENNGAGEIRTPDHRRSRALPSVRRKSSSKAGALSQAVLQPHKHDLRRSSMFHYPEACLPAPAFASN